jgi:hypothetical protein
VKSLHLAALDTPGVYQRLRRLAQRCHHGRLSHEEALARVRDVIVQTARDLHRTHNTPWPSSTRVSEAAEEALAYRLRRVRAQAMNQPRAQEDTTP